MSLVAAFAVPHPPLIVPAVGGGRERDIQDTVDAYDVVGAMIAELRPDTIVISSPHAPLYLDYLQLSSGDGARGSFAGFGAPEAAYEVSYDGAFVGTLEAMAVDKGSLEAGTLGRQDGALDHGTMIPVHFIQKHWPPDVPAPAYVRMGLTGQGPAAEYAMGMLVRDAAEAIGRRTVFVASGDLSHKLAASGPYGFAPEGPVFDARVDRDLASGDFLDLLLVDPDDAERAAECGLRSFQAMAGALDRTAVACEVMSHEGPFGVGYLVASFLPQGPDPSRDFLGQYAAAMADKRARTKAAEHPYVRLARAAVEAWVRDGRRLSAPVLGALVGTLGCDAEQLARLEEPGACFVSLKENGALRGCIGTLAPVQPSLAAEIAANAVSAAARDPRFSAVRPEELDELVYDVDVLGEPEPVDGPESLDPRVYGVVVSTDDGRRGVLLPDLAGVDTVEEQVGIAARKGNIDVSWEPYRLERFSVERYL